MDAALQKLVDESEIRNIVARLAHMADHAEDLTAYFDLWTEDGVFHMQQPVGWKPGDPSKEWRVAGKEALIKDRAMLRSVGFQGPGTDKWHANTTLAVTVYDNDTALAESYWILVNGKDICNVLRIGRYQDTFRRTPQGWKLAYRNVTPHNGGDSPYAK
jgi:hypothetical protein